MDETSGAFGDKYWDEVAAGERLDVGSEPTERSETVPVSTPEAAAFHRMLGNIANGAF